ncbi:MAG: hypothetical protein K8F90_12020 [Hyphomicrobiales bacterium]|nr:hypothetical protein [Hyphomicrobiales bacterium]
MTYDNNRWAKQLNLERRKVTICIAGASAVNSDAACIILCTDWLVSNEIGGSEVMLKQRVLPKGFFCLPSGEEGYMQALMALFRTHILKVDKTFYDDHILKAAKQALFERKQQIADEFIKARYGMSYEDFYSSGLAKMPPDLFREAMSNIKHLDLKTDCVLAGFTDKFSILIETNSLGSAIIKEEFAAVGSGSALATASLMHRQYTDVDPFGKCLYAIYEAKKYSERVGSVGRKTMISILYPDGSSRRLAQEAYKVLEDQYKEYGPREVPYTIDIDPKLILERSD